MKCIRCIVSGRVQGVFFRASARQQALELGLSGVARNLPDGRVEVIACGEQRILKEFQNWLSIGPRHASVEDVEISEAEPQEFNGFRIV